MFYSFFSDLDWNALDDDFIEKILEVDESVNPDTYEFHVLHALGKVTAAEVVHAVTVVRSEG